MSKIGIHTYHVTDFTPEGDLGVIYLLGKHAVVMAGEPQIHLMGYNNATELKAAIDKPVYAYYSLLSKASWDTALESSSAPISMDLIQTNDYYLYKNTIPSSIVYESFSDDSYSVILDPGKPSFAALFRDNLTARMTFQGYDGTFLDYWYPDIANDFPDWFKQSGTQYTYQDYIPTYSPDDPNSWYQGAFKPLIDTVIPALHDLGFTVYGNVAGELSEESDPVIAHQRSLIDGVGYEHLILGWSSGGGQWVPQSELEQRIANLLADTKEVWVSEEALRPNISQFDTKRLASLAAYYIALSTTANRYYHYYRNGYLFWDAYWDYDIGVPIQDPVQVGYTWRRSFTDGLVLLNYENTPQAFNINRSYRSITGATYVGIVSLPAKSAEILYPVTLSRGRGMGYSTTDDVKMLLKPQVVFGADETIGQVPDATITAFIAMADGLIDGDMTGLYGTPLKQTWINGTLQYPKIIVVMSALKAAALLLNKKFGEIEPVLSDRAKELDGRYAELLARIQAYTDILPGQRKYARSHFVTPGIQESVPPNGGGGTIESGGPRV